MEIKGRFYPSSEKLFLDYINECDLYNYISHGFALVDMDGEERYISYTSERPMIAIKRAPSVDEIFRQKDTVKGNLSGLTHLLTRLKHIQIHYGDNQQSWDLVAKELSKEDNKVVLDNFRVTIEYLKGCMFPGLRES